MSFETKELSASSLQLALLLPFLSSSPLPTFVLPSSSFSPPASTSLSLPSPLWINTAGLPFSSSSIRSEQDGSARAHGTSSLQIEGASLLLLRRLICDVLEEEERRSSHSPSLEGYGAQLAGDGSSWTSRSSEEGAQEAGFNNTLLPVEIIYSLGRPFNPIITLLDLPSPHLGSPQETSFSYSNIPPHPPPPPSSTLLVILQLFPLPSAPPTSTIPLPSDEYDTPMLDVEQVSGFLQPPWSEIPIRTSFASPDSLVESQRMRSVSAEDISNVEDLLLEEADTTMDSIPTNLTVPSDWLVEETEMATGEVEKVQTKRKSYGTRELLESYDWSKTPLGPKKDWPQSLITTVSIVQATDHQACVWWGEDFTLIYNEAYAEMSFRKHPIIYGKPVSFAWAEVWEALEPLARSVIGGEAMYKDDDLLFLQRDQFDESIKEETYFSWSFIPVEIEDGSHGGLLNQCFETTSKVLAERRLNVLRALASESSASQSQLEFFQAVANSLAQNPHDIPFAIIYNSEVSHVPHSSTTSRNEAHLASTLDFSRISSVGVPMHHPSVPSSVVLTVNLDSNGVVVANADGSSSCPWPISEAVQTREPVFVENCRRLVEGFDLRSWEEELPDSALVIPIADTDDPTSTKQAILVVGLNTRRPFDQEYQSWLRLLRLQLSSGLSSVISLEQQLQRGEELAKLDRAKTAFFSNISHELRTPLTLIQGPVNDLLREERSESKKQVLHLVSRNVSRLGMLVNSLMDSSRVEAGRMQGSFSPRQLGIFTADLASLFRSAIEKGKIRYTVECDVNDPRMAYVDPDLWEKIVFNIIGNAFKYCLKGSIRVFLKYRENEVEFGVQDTGVGIPKEDIPKVVERFHRVASIGRSHEGTGIGLSLTSELIKMHSGSLSIESSTLEESTNGCSGSTFVVRIPLGSSHLPRDRIEPPESRTQVSSQNRPYIEGILAEAEAWFGCDELSLYSPPPSVGSNESSEFGSRIDPSTLFWSKSDTILIVDDNSDMLKYLSSILSTYCSVIQAENGQIAFQMACEHRPNLVLSDLMMPVLHGIGLLSALRSAKGEIALIPLILITARAGEEEKVNGLLLGAEDYLPKPFSSRELIARCHLQMQMGKRRIELERKFDERTLQIKLQAKEAEEKRKEAEEQRRQQELLVDVTSHEIRNPVSAILQNSGLCKDNLTVLHALLAGALKNGTGFFPTTAIIEELVEDLESLDSIIAMAQSQEIIANDILSLARIQLHTLEIFAVEIDLVHESERILKVFASECRMKDINLGLTIGDSLLALNSSSSPTVKIDSVRLGQILVNLLSNAIRFTAPSTRRDIQVSIDVRRNPPLDGSCLPPSPSLASCAFPRVWVYGSVADSGPGLSPEELSQLFQRFKQASTSTHAVFGGSGLGLYVCRSICELLGGRIEVSSSTQGEGSTFSFFVEASLSKPRSLPPSPPRADSGVSGLGLLPPKPSWGADSPGSGPRVLVVEDNLINQKVLKRQLSRSGLEVDVADDGSAGIDLLRAASLKGDRYLIVLMDLEMPVMDGITAIRTIRELESKGELPSPRQTVYALTGNARQGQIDQALASGMDHVLLKPYKIDELLEKIWKLQH